MASIAKIENRSGTRYRVFIRQRGLPTITRTFTKKSNARDFAKRIEGDREQAHAIGNGAARSLDLGKLIDAFVDQYDKKDATILSRLSWWKERHGGLRMIDLDRIKVKDALRELGAGFARRGNGKGKTKATTRKRSPATVNRYKAALSSVFEFGRDQYDLPDNPCRQIKARTESGGRVRFLSDGERKALLEACQASAWDRLHLQVFMALVTGARLSELLRLRWSDINMKTRRAHVHETKNGTPRVLPLTDELVALLLPLQEVGNGMLFPGTKPGKPFEFRPHWNDAVKAAGVENFRFHDCRHSCASYLAQNGATLIEIAEILGHKQLEVTKRYAHLCVDHKQALVDRVLGGLLEVDNGR